ncbi:metallophosphoesterase family protein [Aureimonas jatrophae]|uniref:Calcineurin-like phosphoesterase superfamily protein n=1 Tax=Aureimonas jatrophae TaxID=1166073 RepID=A0A1H0D4P9_9HYPH|nr:metallophosphoesterase family protein [Aureimonas jatrophae]MBB3951706.1 calcineurin-like phosphoesterase family protein [Aureimonas jatrophae]SDN65123.1 Calcineurin-like phosphoesterase superfamily protein [Aureimonas jatrophae]
MATFFTADTHFNDPRILRLDRRPFADLAAHDAALVANWNAAVGADDEVYHLGDFARGDAASKAALLDRLNGRKHLVPGNNDDDATAALAGWVSVAPYREIVWEGRRVTLCHYALRTWRDMGRGAIDLHGHSHGRLKPMTRQFDVGVDAFPFRPVTLEEIVVSRRRGQPA